MALPQLKDFITQLLTSKAIMNLPVFEKEESVIAFINQNEMTLSARFSTEEYFPHLDWKSVKAELFKTLGEVLSESLKPQLKSMIHGLTLSWKSKYSDFMIPDETFKENLFNLVSKLVGRTLSRVHYAKIVEFISQNVLDPYMISVFETKRYIYNGLSRFDEITYTKANEALDFIYTILLFMPLFDISLPVKVVMPQYSGPINKSINLRDTENNSVLRQSFIMKIKEIINKEMPGISPYFVNLVTHSQYLNEDTENIPYGSKFIKIVYQFASDWHHTKRERGAESFDASWFNVARINYKFYAYDLGTLDEFYKITIEEDL